MKVRLQIHKDKTLLYEGIHEILDAQSFGTACSDAWLKLRERRLGQATSVGALMEILNQNVLEDLTGAEMRIGKA